MVSHDPEESLSAIVALSNSNGGSSTSAHHSASGSEINGNTVDAMAGPQVTFSEACAHAIVWHVLGWTRALVASGLGFFFFYRIGFVDMY
jgi:hypothetical protein